MAANARGSLKSFTRISPRRASNQPQPLGDHRRLGPVDDTQRAENGSDVRLDRALDDAELTRDLLVALALADQCQHFHLAQRQPVGQAAALAGCTFGYEMRAVESTGAPGERVFDALHDAGTG